MTATEPEALLNVAYEQEILCYARALQIAGHVDSLVQHGLSGEEDMGRLIACLKEIEPIEAGIEDAKAEWRRVGRPAGPDLREALQTVAGLITKLRTKLADIERQARGHTERLAPQVDEIIRGRHMRRAYSAMASRERERPE